MNLKLSYVLHRYYPPLLIVLRFCSKNQAYKCIYMKFILNKLEYFLLFILVKRPRYAAVYFPEEQQTSIIPSCKLRDWEFEDQETVTVVWDGAECPAKIIKLSGKFHIYVYFQSVSDHEITGALTVKFMFSDLTLILIFYL